MCVYRDINLGSEEAMGSTRYEKAKKSPRTTKKTHRKYEKLGDNTDTRVYLRYFWTRFSSTALSMESKHSLALAITVFLILSMVGEREFKNWRRCEKGRKEVKGGKD